MTLSDLQERLILCPPFLCRLRARKARGQLPMSHTDIAKATGLPRSTVIDISFRTDWDGLSLDVIYRFTLACGVNPFNPKAEWRTLLNDRQGYMRFTDGNQRRLYARLWKIFERHFKLLPSETDGSQKRAA